MAYIALGLGALFLVFLLVRGFVNANPATLARSLYWLAGIIIALVVIILAWSERLYPVLALAAAVIPIFLRSRGLWQRLRGAAGPTPGKSSAVETEFLRMQLDHDTGTMSGTVKRGRFAGARLAELSQRDLVELLRECRIAEEASASLVEAYLDRAFPDWRQAKEGGDGAPPRRPAAGAMTHDEAYAILGLEPGADSAAIKAAHRRLMQRVHPDHGGSDWLAARLNQARDLLLGA
jgi:hypothetical protein